MIFSMLDNDLYKFTTSYAYMKLYPEAKGVFRFYDRNNTKVTDKFVSELRRNLEIMSHIVLLPSEKEWCIQNIPYVPAVYWEWLEGFKFEYNKIDVHIGEDGCLQIQIYDYLYKATLYEVPILAIVSEMMSTVPDKNKLKFEVESRLDKKIKFANKNHLRFSEFGTRRRFSFEVQDIVVRTLKEKCLDCLGTSNVYFAMKYNMTPMGTFPHEWVMFHGAIWGYTEANYLSMRDWVRVYDGNLGIFLMDTYTSRVGLQSMSLKFAKLFDGVRQDSGDEFVIGEMVIERYKELKIDPTSKTIVFSNALTFEKYLKIKQYFKDRIKVSAGIGTNLTNDVGTPPPNIVMKLAFCSINDSQIPVSCIKMSDDKDKYIGEENDFIVAKYQLKIQ